MLSDGVGEIRGCLGGVAGSKKKIRKRMKACPWELLLGGKSSSGLRIINSVHLDTVYGTNIIDSPHWPIISAFLGGKCSFFGKSCFIAL